MKRRILISVLFTFAALVVGRTAHAQDQALVAKGAQVYAAQKPACTMCHSIAGKGNPKGPLDGVGSKYTADELRQWLVNPKEMTAKHKATRTPPMPAYPKLAKEDMDALVAYMSSLKKK